MDPYSTTVEVIHAVRTVYEKCCEYKEADRTIRDARQCLKVIEVDLELFKEYLQKTQARLPDSRKEVLQASVGKVGCLVSDLAEKLPPSTTVTTKLAWVGWGKRRAEGVLAELKAWDQDTKGTFFMLDIVTKLRDDDELRKRLFDTGDRAFIGAWALSERIYSLDDTHFLPPLPQSSIILPNKHHDRMLGSFQGRSVYMECHYIEEGDDEYKLRQMRSFERMAYVFQSPDLTSLHLLSCAGLVEQYAFDRCYLVYELPDHIPSSSTSPVPTLARALQQQARMTLEDRFRIAVEIAVAVFSIHAAGWVHKDIRSENVLLDVRHAENSAKSTATVGTVYLVGFQATRPRVEGSERRPEIDPVKRIYQHPERQGGRDTQVEKFDIRHDMYSLGAVLIEIGYRKTLREIFGVTSSASEPRPEEPKANHEALVKYARRLSDKMGSKYAEATLLCLNKTTEPGRSADTLREEFYDGVLRPLKEIMDGQRIVLRPT